MTNNAVDSSRVFKNKTKLYTWYISVGVRVKRGNCFNGRKSTSVESFTKCIEQVYILSAACTHASRRGALHTLVFKVEEQGSFVVPRSVFRILKLLRRFVDDRVTCSRKKMHFVAAA